MNAPEIYSLIVGTIVLIGFPVDGYIAITKQKRFVFYQEIILPFAAGHTIFISLAILLGWLKFL